MIQRVAIRGFQSIDNLDMELGGVTVITGANDSGKSAFLRAMQAALTNRAGGDGDFIRDGAKAAEVDLTFADGTVLEWRKPRKTGGTYRIVYPDGRVIDVARAGKDLPDEIANLTGVREVRADNVRAMPQFDLQFDEPFLLSSTGGQAARLLAQVSRFDVLVKAQVEAKRDRDRTRKAVDTLEGEVEELSNTLDGQPDYAAMVERWRALSAQQEAALALQESTARATLHLAAYHRVEAFLAAWATLQPHKVELAYAESTERAKALWPELQQADATVSKWGKLLPKKPVLQAVTVEFEGIARARSAWRALQSQAVLVERWQPLAEKRPALEAAVDAARIVALGREYLAAVSCSFDALVRVTNAGSSLQTAEEELAEALGSMETCPVCGQAMAG